MAFHPHSYQLFSRAGNPTHPHSHHYHSHQQSLCEFRPFIQLMLRQEPSEQRSFVRIDVVLISRGFPDSWTRIAVPNITDSLPLRLRKLIYCKYQSLRIDTCDQNNKQLHPLPCPLPIIITSTHKQHH